MLIMELQGYSLYCIGNSKKMSTMGFGKASICTNLLWVRSDHMSNHNDFGKAGEEAAVAYLKTRGYSIRHRNYRYLHSEIDIIAQKGDVLAIIEVKSRTNPILDHIEDAVSRKKIKRLVLAADHYVTDKGLEVEVRFDIITILKSGTGFRTTHLKDAFYHF